IPYLTAPPTTSDMKIWRVKGLGLNDQHSNIINPRRAVCKPPPGCRALRIPKAAQSKFPIYVSARNHSIDNYGSLGATVISRVDVDMGTAGYLAKVENRVDITDRSFGSRRHRHGMSYIVGYTYSGAREWWWCNSGPLPWLERVCQGHGTKPARPESPAAGERR